MVDSFSTTDNKYSFEIDGKAYVLPSLAFGDVDQIIGFTEAADADKLGLVKNIIFSRADKRTVTAVNTLSVSQVASLFKKWAGLDAGESEASPE